MRGRGTSAPRRWRAPLVMVVAGWLLALAAPASAHAVLQSSTPPADAVVQSAPASVALVFDEGVTLLPDSVRVFGPNGDEVDDRKVVHPGGRSASVGVGLRSGLGDGTYLVSYRVVSADSHPVSGAYTFSIGHPSAPPSAAAASSGSRVVEDALGLGRWLTYAGSALGLGGVLFLCVCWPDGWASRRARRIVGAGTGALVVGTFMALALKGPYDAGLGLAHVADGALFREVLGTTYGRALDVRLILLAVLILVLTYRERLAPRLVTVTAATLLAAVGVTFALCGHAAAGGHRALAIASDTVHVGAMSVWLGGLAMLGAVVLAGPAPETDRLPVVRRFSRVATGGVVVLVATGTFQVLREVRSWDVLFDTHYGHVLLVKLWLVVVALGAAAGSQAWVWQRNHSSVTPGSARGSLRTSVGIESLALVGVLVATSLLVTSDPKAPTTRSAPVSATVTVGPDRVRVSTVPVGSRRVNLRLQVLSPSGDPVEPKEVDAAFSLSGQDVGPLPVTLKRGGPGLRTGVASLPLSGSWQLAVTVRTSAIDEATAYVHVPVG